MWCTTRIRPVRHKYGGCRGNGITAKAAILALVGVGLLGIAAPASAQDPDSPAIIEVALLLEPGANGAANVTQVTESTLAQVYGKGGVASPSSAPAMADASSVTLWDEYLPKRTSNSAVGLNGANSQAGLNVGRPQ
jgi:hypothetical protein